MTNNEIKAMTADEFIKMFNDSNCSALLQERIENNWLVPRGVTIRHYATNRNTGEMFPVTSNWKPQHSALSYGHAVAEKYE